MTADSLNVDIIFDLAMDVDPAIVRILPVIWLRVEEEEGKNKGEGWTLTAFDFETDSSLWIYSYANITCVVVPLSKTRLGE